MPNQLFFLVFWFVIPLIPLPAQDCSRILRDAQKEYDEGRGDLKKALLILQDAETCDKAGNLRQERQSLQKRLFEAIDQQRKSEKAARAAESEASLRVEKINRQLQNALDSLQFVLQNLGAANADKVRLLLAEANRNALELNFDAATDKMETAKLLHALPDSVGLAYENLTRLLLTHARNDIQGKAYGSALDKINKAKDLNTLTDSVYAVRQMIHRALLDHVRMDILHTNYDAAAEKTNLANTRDVPQDTLASLYFEIAFCYMETGQLDHAAALLDTVALLLDHRPTHEHLRNIAGDSPSQKQRLLRQLRQQLDPQQEEILILKYLPNTYINVPAGGFTAAANSGNDVRAANTCQAIVEPFWLAAHEVTFYAYDLFCAATLRRKPSDNGWGRGARPVVNVTWYDAVEYCNWRSRQEGLHEVYTLEKKPPHARKRLLANWFRNVYPADQQDGNAAEQDSSAAAGWQVRCDWSANGYRLPSEVEWEFAAGNGAAHTRFGWGDAAPDAQKGGNVSDETTGSLFPDWQVFRGYSDGFVYAAPVGAFTPNAFGLFDMTGNVWEWCWDAFESDFCHAVSRGKTSQWSGPEVNRALRGGSWGSWPDDCLVSKRTCTTPSDRNLSIGFRLARN